MAILRTAAILAVGCIAATVFGSTTWFVDDDAPNDPGPGDPLLSDPAEDGTPEHPFDAIQEGIDAATDGDTVLVLDGTYVGVGNRNIDFAGRLITVTSSGGAGACAIDCQASPADEIRGFDFHSGETTAAVLSGFTIRGGSAWHSRGGAIRCRDGSGPTIRDCVIADNVATYGAGIDIVSSDPHVINCKFDNNQAGGGGGIAILQSDPEIRGCAFRGNWSERGDGVYNRASSPTIVQCDFIRNTSNVCIYNSDASEPFVIDCAFMVNDAGIYSSDSAPTIIGCKFVSNLSPFCEANAILSESCRTTVIRCTFAGNLAPGWGAIFNQGGDLAVCDSAFIANETDYALYDVNGNVLIDNCTFVGHREFAMFLVSHSYHEFHLRNCILDEQQWSYGQIQLAGGALSIDHTLLVGGQDTVEIGYGGTLHWLDGNIDADPHFEEGVFGSWTRDSVTDWDTLTTTYTDDNASWVPGSLVGLYLKPNIAWGTTWANVRVIAGNTETTITAWDYQRVSADAVYQITDYRLSPRSRCIDAGNSDTLLDPEDRDLDGHLRLWDGDQDGEAIIDMGSQEFGAPCLGDLDVDGTVTLTDLAILLGNYGQPGGPASGDSNYDGTVDLADLAALLGAMQNPCP